MSIYITVYIALCILLLIILNLLFTRKKRDKSKRENRNSSIDQVNDPEKLPEQPVKLEQADKPAELQVTALVPEPNKDLQEQVEDMLKDSAIPEPALEYVEADVQPKEEDRPERLSRVENTKKEVGRGKILTALMLGAFVAILNQTLLNVAIPHIMADLNVSATTVQWLSTGYMLVNGICIPVTAFLIEKFGTRKLFLIAILLFTIGSIICSFSTNFTLLMTGRVVQACGAGVIMPLLMTVMFALYPPEKRGMAMGMMGIVMLFAPAVGPTLSGWLIEHYSWRLLFDVVIPIGIIDLILSVIWMRDVTKITNPKFDFPGLLFSTIGFGFLLYGFSEAGSKGWSSTIVIVSLIIGIVSLTAFVVREISTDNPMLDLRVFKYDIFALTTAISMIINMAMFGAMILLPIYLQNIRGFTALQSGLMLLPGAIIMGIMSPIAGAIFDKIGARWLAVVGLTITVITTWQFTTLSMSTSYSHILFLYVMRMFGMSFLMMTVMTEGLNQLPRHLGAHGTAAANTARQVAGSIGTAFLVTVMSTRQEVHYGQYSNLITSTNPYISGTMSYLGGGLAAYTHMPLAAGKELATYVIYGQTMQQTTIEGINDAFVVATGIAFVAWVLAFFIKRAKVRAQ